LTIVSNIFFFFKKKICRHSDEISILNHTVVCYVLSQPWATINNNNDPKQTEKNIWIDMNCGANGQGNSIPNRVTINKCLGTPPNFNISRKDLGALNIDLNTGKLIELYLKYRV